jgi:hypothetical protein
MTLSAFQMNRFRELYGLLWKLSTNLSFFRLNVRTCNCFNIRNSVDFDSVKNKMTLEFDTHKQTF